MSNLRRIFKVLILGGVIAYTALLVFFWSRQEGNIFQGIIVAQDHNYGFALANDDVWFDRPDGARIHAVRFNPSGQAGRVIYFHGNGGNVEYASRMARLFAAWDFEVLAVDYRGYGKSRGELNEEALLADILAIYDAESTTELPIVVAHSLGTIFATYMAANRPVDRLVLFAPPSSLQHIMRTYFPYAPSFLLRYPFRTDQYIQQVDAPIDIFHGTDDSVVAYQEGLILADLLKPNDQFHTIEGAGHMDVLYRPDVLDVLRERPESP